MNISCPSSESLFSSSEFLVFWSHVITIFTLPINIFVSYIVLFHTPNSMNPIRIVILNAQLWSTFSDLMIGTLSIPFVFFPLMAGMPYGILKDFGVSTLLQTYVVSCFISEVGSSLILIIESQQFIICGDRALVRNKYLRRTLQFFNYFATFVFLAPAYKYVEVDYLLRAELLRIIPCPHHLFTSDRFFVANNSLVTVACCFATCILIFTFQGVAFIINSCYHLFITVCAQVSLPLFIIVLPISYIIFSMATGYYNQGVNNLVFLVLSTHGFFNSLSTMLVYEKYRKNTVFKLKVKLCEIFFIR